MTNQQHHDRVTAAANDPLTTSPAATEVPKDVDTKVSFTPATDIWVPGFDQFGRPCWQNKKTQKTHYNLTEQLPRSFGDSTSMKFPHGPYFRPEIGTFTLRINPQNSVYDIHVTTTDEQAKARPTPSVVEDNKTASATSSKDTREKSSNKVPPLEKQSLPPSPAPPTSRTQAAKQWSRERDSRGYYYLNSTTGEKQSETPDCLKKYTSRF